MNTILDKYEQDIEDSFDTQKSIKTKSLVDNLKTAATKHLKSKKSITIRVIYDTIPVSIYDSDYGKNIASR